MNKVLFLLLLFITSGIAYSQQPSKTISGGHISLITVTHGTVLKDTYSESTEILPVLLLISPFNPMLVIEDKKAYFALTKEVSLAFPFFDISSDKGTIGKIGFEYSYVFRSERNSHLRVFAEICYPIHAGDFAAILINAGGGYFTDTKKSGLFPQVSAGILLPLSDSFALDFYIKARETFMFKKEESNIFDLSAGIGTVLYPF